ncbi:MAG TPA: hypothetical protein VHY34_10215 [Caulobacteraceae bacterium]|jgi:hypothetical protein|nr:hypothetical protein [Caulobacteraceae bacterium]
MPTPVELSNVPSTESYLADSEYDGFALDAASDDDGVYEEISERRAQLENADILRGARAL